MKELYDLVIIGAGPAGLTAAIYAQRAQLKTLVLEKLSPGGQLLLSAKIENYPGFSDAIPAQKLVEQMQKQAENLGMNLKLEEVKNISQQDGKKIVRTFAERQYEALTIIIATGTRPSRLGVEGEEKLIGQGVSYCAICDAPFFKNKTVAVVGGGSTALEEGLYLAKFASKVYLVHRRGMFRAEKILAKRVTKNPKIEIVWNSIVEEICGGEEVEKIKIKNLKTEKISNLICSGIFIFVGLRANTEFIKDFIELDNQGFIKTDERLEANIKGIFACGDVRNNLLKQIIVACGEGALATHIAEVYVSQTKGIEYK
jgi:thioredoxin reductase (NADPH)